MNETVLLIDDSKFLRRINELAVSRSGYLVLVAADGDEGLRLAREKIPDVIVLDMMLPKLSGEQLIQKLKVDPNALLDRDAVPARSFPAVDDLPGQTFARHPSFEFRYEASPHRLPEPRSI